MITSSRIQILLVTFVLLVSFTQSTAQDSNADETKAVLVTGASTGIGRNIAERLAAEGYFVYAGARKQQDLDALNAVDNVQAIRLDVTKPGEIDAAVETLRAAGRGLYGLVNNAGVIIVGPSIETDVEDIQWLFDVNVLGVYRVTQAFAPLIIESKGRITTIGSIAGSIGIPLLGAYTMSKHAIEAYTDSLAGEMAGFDVEVSLIAPGNFSSNIWDKYIARSKEDGLVDEDSPYATTIAEFIERVEAIDQKEPDAVSDATLHALFGEQPKRRYLVVPNQGEAGWALQSLVRRVAQLNSEHEHSFTDKELLQMLKTALATQHQQ